MLGKDTLQLLNQRSKVLRDDLVNDRTVNPTIIMDKSMTHSGDEGPGNRRVGVLEVVEEFPSSLSDNFYASLNRQERTAIRYHLFDGHGAQ